MCLCGRDRQIASTRYMIHQLTWIYLYVDVTDWFHEIYDPPINMDMFLCRRDRQTGSTRDMIHQLTWILYKIFLNFQNVRQSHESAH